MLSIQNITAGYGGEPVLREVSIDVARGEFVGLIGPNGCGKTTLLRVVSGVLAPTAGRILLGDEELRRVGRRRLARTMACLSQDISLDLSFTVREVVMMGRSPHVPAVSRETGRDFEIVDRAMELADVSRLGDRLVNEISGGERQRAFIAMCLAQEPEVFLLDEPTSHLDVGHVLGILDLIRTLNRDEGMTVVAVFHDLNLAAEYCERLLVLNEGRIEALGRPQDVLTADMIRNVYGANVVTEPNPVSQRPHVVISAGMNRVSPSPGTEGPRG